MPTIYLSGQMLPEARGGTVRGGLAVALHDPAEVDGLIALCVLAPRPPENPIAGLYRALGDPSLDLAAWAAHWQDLEVLGSQASTASLTVLSDTDPDKPFLTGQVGKLLLALKVAKELWLSQEAELNLLSLVVLLAGPDGLDLDGDGGALVIQPGSELGAQVVRLPLHVSVFAAGLFVGGGTSTSARRESMVARMREEAIKSGSPALKDIRELSEHSPDAEISQRPLLVLVHGLFATDVGTFSALQWRLEKHFEVVGFPHDTLSESIEANALELALLLTKLQYPRVYCAAHSRGGLVVRSAAVLLAKEPGNKVAIQRCATFGTPHLGAEMAENPGSLIATIALLKASVADKSVAGVVDMLCCVAEKEGYPGIRDLRPASTDDTWLFKLQADEGLRPDAKMRLFAVGGVTRSSGIMQRIAEFSASRIMGRKPSDLVVAKSSSLPFYLRNCEEVTCDHFSYFREGQESASTLNRVVDFLCSS